MLFSPYIMRRPERDARSIAKRPKRPTNKYAPVIPRQGQSWTLSTARSPIVLPFSVRLSANMSFGGGGARTYAMKSLWWQSELVAKVVSAGALFLCMY